MRPPEPELRRSRGVVWMLGAFALACGAGAAWGAIVFSDGVSAMRAVPATAEFHVVARADEVEKVRAGVAEAGARARAAQELGALVPELAGHGSRLVVLPVSIPVSSRAALERVPRIEGVMDAIDLNRDARMQWTRARAWRWMGTGVAVVAICALLLFVATRRAAAVCVERAGDAISLRHLFGAELDPVWSALSLESSRWVAFGLFSGAGLVLAAYVLVGPSVAGPPPLGAAVWMIVAGVLLACLGVGVFSLTVAFRRGVMARGAVPSLVGLAMMLLVPAGSADAGLSAPTRLARVGRDLAVCRHALHTARIDRRDSEMRVLRHPVGSPVRRLVRAQLAAEIEDERFWKMRCETLARRRGELRRARAWFRNERRASLPELSWIRPVPGDVGIRWGAAGREPRTAAFRNGVGLEVSSGQKVRAAAKGRVAYAGELGEAGLVVVVDHGHRVFSVYGQVAEALVGAGTEVNAGEPIARAPAGGGLLYFSLRHRGTAVDPLSWVGRHASSG